MYVCVRIIYTICVIYICVCVSNINIRDIEREMETDRNGETQRNNYRKRGHELEREWVRGKSWSE